MNVGMPRHMQLRAAAMLVLLLLAIPQVALAEKRVALVIGNGAYLHTPKLPNPPRDAKAIADLFRKAGFDSVLANNDVGHLAFKRSLRDLEEAAQGSDIAVLFFAGHGVQIGDQNYMLPTDSKLEREYDAKDETISLERIVEALEPAKRLRLVILDACRDNPFLATMQRRVALRGALTRGLARVEPTQVGTLIAYAAKAGASASDGADGHSPFTKALLKHIAEPGLDIRLAFGRIRDEVVKITRNEQEPFVYGSLGGDNLSLVPAPAVPKESELAAVAADYNLVEQINTKLAWEVFINTHKSGILVDMARKRLEKLEQEAPSANPKLASLPPPNEEKKATPAEIMAWNKVKGSGDAAAIRKFMDANRSSPLASEARQVLEALELEKWASDLAERVAARKREEEARRAKAEADRLKAEREAALAKAAREKAEADRKKAELQAKKAAEAEAERKRLAEAERQKAEREAASAKAAREKAELEAQLAKAAEAEAERKRQAEADRQKAEREAALAKTAREKAEAERKRAELEAQRAAEAEAERRRLAEAERLKAEREAALAKAAREKAEAERKKAEREAQLAKAAEAEAERKRAAEAEAERKRAAEAEAERKRVAEACAREEKSLARLKTAVDQASGREELERFARTLGCEQLRPALVALQAEADRLKQAEVLAVRTAQAELRRIGCFSGQEDGKLQQATKDAINRYLAKSGKQQASQVAVDQQLINELKAAPTIGSCEDMAPSQKAPKQIVRPQPRREPEEPRKLTKVQPTAPGPRVMTGVGF